MLFLELCIITDMNIQERELRDIFQGLISQNNSSNGGNSGDIGDILSERGFEQTASNVYVCREDGVYYGEIITQSNVTIIYIKQRNAAIVLTAIFPVCIRLIIF